ncbi:hypothetical protein L2E82_31705 [Cichorium intybus]|uniref:Uncharacterized protein n=1 Tax=Cichorium intybus TaxID=13427 RepID=A0ACB9BDY8_CICIN|nr:hypothetical protein L2E82_31705 [Cichorium intybus]
MLFTADMRNIIETTGKLLLAFLIGSVGTIIGTVVALMIVPMRSMGENGWKVACALMASHIGGGINYAAVADKLGVSSSSFAAGVAADKVICAIYFMVLFAFASKIPSEASPSTDDPTPNLEPISTIQVAAAVAVSFTICKVARHITPLLKLQSGTLPAITSIFLILATLLPTQIRYLAPTGDAVAAILIQVFFVVLGASGSIWNVMTVAPSVFVFGFIQVTVHLFVILRLGKLLGLDLKLLLLASNANIGGPTTASWMATSNGWGSLVIPGILVGIFGNFIATNLAHLGSFPVAIVYLFMMLSRFPFS